MSKSKTKKKGRVMWGFIYVVVFLTAFLASVVMKMTADPFHGKYTVKWDESVGTVYADLSYGEGAANKFDLYVPADSSRDSYGLAVYLHAGGFTTGDKQDDQAMLQWLCSKGYVAAGINYTLRDEAHPEASVYSQSVEIRDSIPHVIAEAEKLGYKVDKMAISGGSAGGTLALLYAYRDAEQSPVPVKMVFEAVGPASFHHEDWKNYGLDQNTEAAANLFSVMSGNAITEEMITSGSYDEQVKDISADMWVNENTVPTVCAYGAQDKVCPFDSVKHLVNALEANDVPHEYFELTHSGHALQNDNKLYAAYMDAVEDYHTMVMADGWEYDISRVNIPTFLTAGTGSWDAGNATSKEQVTDDKNGVAQGICPLWSLQENYSLLPETVDKVIARKKNVDHGDSYKQFDGYMTAWFVYHLQGDTEAGKAFAIGGELSANSLYQDVQTNINE